MVVMNFAGQAEAVVGQNADSFASVFDRDRAADAQIAAFSAILANSSLLNELQERQAAAIQDRHFQVVDFNVGVVDPAAIKYAEQVLGGRNQNAFSHQAGGVADAGDMTP